MTIDKEIKKGITRGDVILVAAVLLLSAILFIMSFSGERETLRAEIYLSGEKVQEILLSDITESYTIKIGECELLIEKNGVTFISSECSDKLCIKKGKLTRKGDAMACVPEKVVVNIKSIKGKTPDSVTY
ncbi:MAG: NusG domain II-containing protein [Clostridia bacterium]|nr:NusG domain II-containing protein [Clostridia bacterium]